MSSSSRQSIQSEPNAPAKKSLYVMENVMSDTSTVENTADINEAEMLQLMMHDMARSKFKLD